jgi:hypothetical protein
MFPNFLSLHFLALVKGSPVSSQLTLNPVPRDQRLNVLKHFAQNVQIGQESWSYAINLINPISCPVLFAQNVHWLSSYAGITG